MAFEWDDVKRDLNLRKHGVDFTRAVRIFANPFLERIDDRADYGEVRWVALGQWQGDFMTVIFTWRGENRRIISAWKAGSNDRATYHKRLSGGS